MRKKITTISSRLMNIGRGPQKKIGQAGRTLLFVAAVAGLFIGASGAPVLAATTDAIPNSVLQQDVNRIRNIGTTGVLAVTTNGTDVTRARAGVAERGTSQPVPWESHVRIGSTTKTFISTVILQLEAEGKLSLNDTVEHWLPGVVQGNGNHGEHITIRHLLQHTSGLFDYLEDDDFVATILTPEAFYQNRFNTYTPQQLIQISMSHAPNFGPGAKWEYSNVNYTIAGEIIKATTGKSWSTQVKDRIITPLGLSETKEPGTNASLPTPFPRGYQLFGSDGVYTDTTLHNMTWGGAAGSLISTPKDVNRFFKALMKGQLLSPGQLAKMQTTVSMGPDYEEYWPGAAYGLGIIRTDLSCGGVYWGHGGDVIGYSNTNGVTPDGKRSAMVASSTNTFADAVFADNSIRSTEKLVQHALCGNSSNSASSNASDPASSLGGSGTTLKRSMKL